MTMLERLRRRQAEGRIAAVAVSGAGFVGRALVGRVHRTPAMRAALVVSRTPLPAISSYADVGIPADEVVVSDDVPTLRDAIRAGRPAVTRRAAVLSELGEIDAVVEATGAVEHGAQVALHAISGGMHVIMVNAETDATVGPALRTLADEAGVVYTGADGDQPAVLKRLIDFADGIGLRTVAALNCKGFLDVHATPCSIAEWSARQGTSPRMTTAFTDGTKMNIENAVLANATGLRPARRGMVGVRTTLAGALADCRSALGEREVVDYTLGGDFGGGVFVIAEAEDPESVRAHLRYYKMGDGPDYLLYRPYHLCHLEVPASIAEAVLDGIATIAPRERVAEVVAIAKADLRAGQRLDGIGGFTCYGHIDSVQRAEGLLPIGLAEGAVLARDVRRDRPIELADVQLDDGSTLLTLRSLRDRDGFTRDRRSAA